MSGATAGIYVALPFCPSQCHYCSNQATRFTDVRAESYLHRLEEELRTAAPDWGGYEIDTVFIGGGTPTMFPTAMLARVLDMIAAHYDLSAAAEITSEANPETVTPKGAKGMLGLGINRISIGAQTFQPRHLMALGRVHSPNTTVKAVRAAREAGFRSLSLDLIFSLPDQQLSEWEDDLAQIIALKPDHVAAYGLAIEPGTALWVQVQSGKISLPDADGYDRFYTTAVERLAAAGYARYEVSNFAKPGHECRHNLRYWEIGDYLGVGAGAATHRAGRRYAQVADVTAYGQQTDSHPMVEGERLSARDQAYEMAIFGLRTARGIDLDAILARTGTDLASEAGDALERLASSGLITREGAACQPTDRGFLFNDTIGAALARDVP